MELSLFDREQRARLESRFLGILLALVALSAVLLTPLSVWSSTDVLLSDTVLPLAMDFLLEIANYVFFWISFATVLYTVYRYGLGASFGVCKLYAGAVLVRYLAYLFAGYVVLGFPTRFADAWQDDVVYLLLDVLMDYLQMGVILLFSYRWMERSRRTRRLGTPAYPDWLPYRRAFAWRENPLLRTVAVSALLPALIRFFSRVIYDLSLGAAATLGELLWQIFSYSSDVVYMLVGYLVMLLLLNAQFLRDTKAYRAYAEAISEEPEKI